jgi:hypothetical protein
MARIMVGSKFSASPVLSTASAMDLWIWSYEKYSLAGAFWPPIVPGDDAAAPTPLLLPPAAA